MARALDCKYTQALVHHPGDAAGFNWHHRLFLHRVEGSRWICLTPDFDLVRIDHSHTRHRVVVRRQPFPADIAAECYMFDPIENWELANYQREARQRAHILVADVVTPTTIASG